MVRVLLAVTAVVLVSSSSPVSSAPPPDPLTEPTSAPLGAWAPGALASIAQAELLVVEALEPARSCGVAGAHLADVLVLAALLALRTISERLVVGRH